MFPEAEVQLTIAGGRPVRVIFIRDKDGNPIADKEGKALEVDLTKSIKRQLKQKVEAYGMHIPRSALTEARKVIECEERLSRQLERELIKIVAVGRKYRGQNDEAEKLANEAAWLLVLSELPYIKKEAYRFLRKIFNGDTVAFGHFVEKYFEDLARFNLEKVYCAIRNNFRLDCRVRVRTYIGKALHHTIPATYNFLLGKISPPEGGMKKKILKFLI